MDLAVLVSGWSKDPSTKIGAVIARPNKTIASVGFNGFPRGIADDSRLNSRGLKYPIIIHAELNAILNCYERPEGYNLYCTVPPCGQCAAAIIQSGIRSVTSPFIAPEGMNQLDRINWDDLGRIARDILTESGVLVFEYIDRKIKLA